MKVNRVENSDAVCGFCGRRGTEVERMIAGTTASICDECVSLCIDALGDGNDQGPGTDETPVAPQAAMAAALHEYAVDQTLSGIPGAELEADLRTLAAAALMRSGHFDVRAAAAFAALDVATFERALSALGPAPGGTIRPSTPPPPL